MTGLVSPSVQIFPAPEAYRAREGATLPMREFLFGPAYQKEQVTLTIAGGGTGKTSLCIAEAVAMASGTGFLEKPKRPLRVWIYNGEEPVDELDRRVKAAAIAQGLDHAELRESLFVNSGRGAKRIDLSKSVQNKGTQVKGVSEFLCPGRVELHAMMKRSSNKMANWDFASPHSRGGIFHSAVASRKTSQISFVAASSVGK